MGAAIALSGSVVLRVLCGTESRPETLQAPIIVAFLVCCLVAMIFGAFNGVLVAYFKIQPMVATLILFTAGRSIAAWIRIFRKLYSRHTRTHAYIYRGAVYDNHCAGAALH